MNKNSFFENLEEIEPNQEIFESIMLSISLAERRSARIKLTILGGISLLSFLAIFPLLQYSGNQFYQSGFTEYFSLIFSDWTTLSIYWKDLMISLAESLPILSTTAILLSVFVLLTSLRSAIKNFRPAFNAPKFI